MSSTNKDSSSSISTTESSAETEAQNQIRKAMHTKPPLRASATDFSTIPISLEIGEWPFEAEVWRAYYHRRARKTKWNGPPAESLVVDFGDATASANYYAQPAVQKDEAKKEQGLNGPSLDETKSSEAETKNETAPSKKKRKSKKIWALYGKLKARV